MPNLPWQLVFARTKPLAENSVL